VRAFNRRENDMALKTPALPTALTGEALDRAFNDAHKAQRQVLLDATAAYDPADAVMFAKLLRRSMDIIEDHQTLARRAGVSVATLHRWSKQKGAPSPLERAGVIALLRTVLIHGLPMVDAHFDRMLKAVAAQLAAQMPDIAAAHAHGASKRKRLLKRTGAGPARTRSTRNRT
jgi:hypothetical protein